MGGNVVYGVLELGIGGVSVRYIFSKGITVVFWGIVVIGEFFCFGLGLVEYYKVVYFRL